MSLTNLLSVGGLTSALGGGGGAGLTPDGETGPVFEDDFNRADSDTPGNGWVEYGSDWDIASNELTAVISSGTIRGCQQETTTGGAMFVQAILRGTDSSGSAGPTLGARQSINASGPQEGYHLRLNLRDDLLNILEYTAAAATSIASAVKTMVNETNYPTQLYVADGVQEGWVDGTSLSAANTAHNGATGRYPAIVGQGLGGTHTHYGDDFIWMPSPYITVSGLEAGWKAKVLNSGESVVAEATESGGTATIDCSRFGGATELVPIGGWAALIVTDGADVEQARYSEAGIFPGYAYSL